MTDAEIGAYILVTSSIYALPIGYGLLPILDGRMKNESGLALFFAGAGYALIGLLLSLAFKFALFGIEPNSSSIAGGFGTMIGIGLAYIAMRSMMAKRKLGSAALILVSFFGLLGCLIIWLAWPRKVRTNVR